MTARQALRMPGGFASGEEGLRAVFTVGSEVTACGGERPGNADGRHKGGRGKRKGMPGGAPVYFSGAGTGYCSR